MKKIMVGAKYKFYNFEKRSNAVNRVAALYAWLYVQKNSGR